MPGYSGTPLARKLGIKEDSRVLLAAAPDDFERELDGLPPSAIISRTAGRTTYGVIVAFATSARELTTHFQRLIPRLDRSGGLWIAWPKKASGVPTDVTEAVVRDIGLATGLVDNKVCAVTDLWSGLRFVVRVKDRTAPPRKRSGTNARRTPANKRPAGRSR